METMAIICFTLIMYSVANTLVDYLSKNYKMTKLSDIFPLMIFCSVVISIFTSYPFYLLKYHKIILDTLPVYVALVIMHLYISLGILYLTSKEFKKSNYSTKYHIIHMLSLVILTLLILR